MSDLNPEKEKGPGMAQKAGNAIKEQGKEQLKKAGKKAIQKQMAKKAGQQAVKQVASKAALAGPLGYVLFWALIIILIIIVIVGIVMFVVTMPGMVMDKLKALAKAVGNAIASWFGADSTKLQVDNEQIYGILEHLEQMGYDLQGEGFLTKLYDEETLAASDKFTEDEKLKLKAENGMVKNKDGGIEEAESLFIYNYLVSDNYVYTVKNFNMTTEGEDGYKWWSPFAALGGRFLNLFGNTGSEIWGKGMIAIYHEVDGKIGTVGEFYGNGIFHWNDIDVSAKSKTMSIRRGWGSNKMVYSLDGWTGRYGMPLEFLLSVHMATKMPDLTYDMTKAFKDIQVQVLLHPLDDVSAITAYKKDFKGTDTINEDYITYDEMYKVKGEGWSPFDGWTLSKEEGQKVLLMGVNSPNYCTYTAATFEMLDASDNGDGWIFDDDKNAELKGYGFNGDEEFASINAELNKVVTKGTGEKFDAKEAMKEVKDEGSMGTKKSSAESFGYNYNTVKENGAYIVNGSPTESKPEILEGRECIEGDCKCTDSHSLSNPGSGVTCTKHSGGGNYTAYVAKCPPNTFYGVEKFVVEREWQADYDKRNDKNEKTGEIIEDVTFRWVTYVFKIYKYTDSSRSKNKTYITSYMFDYIMRDLSFDELVEKEVLNKDGTAKSENRCSKDKDLKECCESCRKHVKQIMKHLKAGNDPDFATYTPYISKVTGHWYRDVYFVSDANKEFVRQDEEYEAIMGERWTLYETDPETGLYVLYKLNSDGSIGEKFDGTQQDANEKGIAVTKKAETVKISDSNSGLNWNKVNGVYTAYELSDETKTSGWEKLYEDADLEKEPYKERLYLKLTTQDDIAQVEEGQRTQTNPKIKDIFLNNTYFKYDGSVETAQIIDKLRRKMSSDPEENLKMGELSETELKTTIEYDTNGNGKIDSNEKYTAKDFAGKVELTQNSLSAFSMLENTHTLDADFIYKDFKELVVELGYFTKEELSDETPRIFAFPVPEIGSYGFPIASLDKKENEFGTQLHSKEDYKANEKNTLKALIQEMGSEIPEEVANEQATAVSNPIEGLLSISGNFDLSEIGAITEAEKKVSQVSLDEFLEKTREMCEYINKEGYDYCVLVGDAGDGNQNCHHDAHKNSCSLPTTFEASKESVGKHNMCCATLVSWALQNVKVMPDSAHQDGANNLAQWIADNLDAKLVKENEKIQPGDILCYKGTVDENKKISGMNHIDLVGEETDGGFVKYNGGGYAQVGAVDFGPSSAIEKITGTTPGECGAKFALRLNWGNSSGGGAFEGYEGGESVVSPVTGILLEYGVYDDTVVDPLTGEKSRLNVDLKYQLDEVKSPEEKTEEKVDETPKDETPVEQPKVIDKVGYAKIMILDDETYLALERKMKSSATNALGSFSSLVDEDGNYYENKVLKEEENILESEKWSEEDITLYGYKEFAEMYSDFKVSGNIIYIDGFICESPIPINGEKKEDKDAEKEESDKSTEDDKTKDVSGEKITFGSFTPEYKATLYEKEDRYNLSSKDATNKLNNENEIKDAAQTVVKVTIDGKERVIIKEGTVIGRTMTNKELAESRGETYTEPVEVEEKEEGKDSADETGTKFTGKLLGNYLRIMMRDQEDTVVENVEEYMKLDEMGQGSGGNLTDLSAQIEAIIAALNIEVVDESNGNIQKANEYWEYIEKYSAMFELDPYLVRALMCQESGADPTCDGAAIGLMQWEKTNGDPNITVELESGETVTAQTTIDEMRNSPELQIKVGCAELKKNLIAFENNVGATLVGYNFGTYGCYGVINYHTSGHVGAVPHHANELTSEGLEYVKSGDIKWLQDDERQQYRNLYSAGDPQYVEHVLRYYITTE